MSEQTVVTVDSRDECTVAVVQCSSLGEEETATMQAGVAEAAASARHLPVVLNLTNVEFVPSLSLGALVNMMRDCKQNQQRFIITDVQAPVRDCLAVTRLDKLFEICDSVDDAVTLLRG